ncbi:MAG: argininosuccinate lyase [Christensenellales bacterium]
MKLWGGRFQKNSDAQMDGFHSSISFDARLYKQDILGSIAHARMLGKQGIIPVRDSEAIIRGLQEILSDIEAGKVSFDVAAEDIHTNVETLLTQRIGEAGKKLHTGRSRNDQVALDMRMYMKESCTLVEQKLKALCALLVSLAKEHTGTVMPGYTHLQKAQPVTLAHHFMAYFEMFYRDATRFIDCYKRMDAMPLGAGALAGSTYPLDRNAVAGELGFATITRNSMDAVSDRDFCIEFVFCASLSMMHLSRFCEEIVRWSTGEFGFVELSDAYATGSSIMPQKKNPDSAELIRGKTGRVYGALMTLLTVMKGLPLAYNTDMQEDKEATFDALDTVQSCFSIFTAMLKTASFKTQRMAKEVLGGFANATDGADYLVRKGMPFREAHEIMGRLVLQCIDRGTDLLSLPLEEYQQFSLLFGDDVYDALSLKSCVEKRNLPGGPAPEAVKNHIKEAEALLKALA